MENETALEKAIKQFVFSKIQEQVRLDISKKNTVLIRSRSEHGSIALAMFWLRVLRHQNNYPMPKYPYKDLYDKKGNNKVLLKVDNVTLTTLMSTGTLMIEGFMVLEWFVNTFHSIMEAYDAPIRDPQPKSCVYRQYTETWKQMEKADSLKKDIEDEELRVREETALSILDDNQGDSEKVEDSVKKEKGSLQTAEIPMTSQALYNDAAEEMELMALDVWPAETVRKQLEKLRCCTIMDSQFYVYPLWKSLLHHWFSDPGCSVFIVTPHLDAKRLVDICHIILEHRLTANLDCFYVQQSCDYNQRIFEVKQAALQTFDAKDQMFLEYKIYANIIYPVKRFNAKFIAAVKDNVAEVLITSANFHRDHFDQTHMDSVCYQTMPAVDFVQRFLSPINASVQVRKQQC